MQSRNPTDTMNKHMASLAATINELRVNVVEIEQEPERVVEMYDEADRSIRICNNLMPQLSESERKKHAPKLEGYQRYLNQIKGDVQAHSRSALLAGATNKRSNKIDPSDPEQAIKELKVSSEDSLKRSLAMTEEAAGMGAATAQQLQQQRAQLEHSRDEVNRINQMMDQSEYLLRGIKSLAGAFSNVFRKAPTVDAPSSARSTTYQPNTTAALSARSGKGQSSEASNTTSTGTGQPSWARSATTTTSSSSTGGAWGGSERVSGEGGQVQAQVQDDMTDQYLSQLSQNLGQLKELGKVIGDEIDSQNVLIEGLSTDVDRVNSRITKNNGQIKKILK
eukprot:c6081_g1_i2.p1 GENE.c6081_g1_i2~~c6081_g1_i2.p1  ORF type:complete len:350 (-),score=75.95 c6081_g1_i2:75-1082(-)